MAARDRGCGVGVERELTKETTRPTFFFHAKRDGGMFVSLSDTDAVMTLSREAFERAKDQRGWASLRRPEPSVVSAQRESDGDCARPRTP